MPRKRRPTPPLPGSIVRNLAPKPDPSQGHTDNSSDRTPALTSNSSRQSTAGSDVESSYCGVPQCNTLNCRLQTHINYGKQRKLSLLQSSRASGLPQSSATKLTESTSHLTIKPTMDEKIRLPISDTPNQDFQRLLVHFFDTVFDEMVLIFRPQLRDPAFKQSIYRLAFHNPVYCLTLVAQAHMTAMKDSVTPLDPAGDALTDTIYTRLLKMTREKIEFFDLDDVDVLLMAIVVLCEYDLQLHQYDALSTHHNGMKVLVSKRGGIHNLGLSLPYVLRMDRFLAIRLNQMPQFASLDNTTANVMAHQTQEESLYGSYFQESSSGLSEQVGSVCSDSARLLEIMEDLDITFNHAKVPDAPNPKIEYFYFIRENIEVRYSILNHQSNRGNASVNLDRLVLCAGQLVTYYIAEKNYLPLVSDLLATRLWNMLTNAPNGSPNSTPGTVPPLERGGSDPSTTPKIDLASWKNNMPTLLWLLFACALPSYRATTMTFTGHLSSALSSPGSNKSPPTSASKRSSPSQSHPSRSITSPSSPRRQRYLPSYILYVAEHLVGERPLSGTGHWEIEVTAILENYVWAGDRLTGEFENVMRKVHEGVLARAQEEED